MNTNMKHTDMVFQRIRKAWEVWGEKSFTGCLGNEKSFKQVAFFSSFPLEKGLYLLPLNIFVLKT